MNKATLPKTFEEAIAQGYRICEESLAEESSQPGGLRRQGMITVERLHRETGDAEKIEFPYTATVTIGRAGKYKMRRHSYLTPTEAAEFNASFQKQRAEMARGGQ